MERVAVIAFTVLFNLLLVLAMTSSASAQIVTCAKDELGCTRQTVNKRCDPTNPQMVCMTTGGGVSSLKGCTCQVPPPPPPPPAPPPAPPPKTGGLSWVALGTQVSLLGAWALWRKRSRRGR